MIIYGKNVGSAAGPFVLLFIFGLSLTSYYWKRSATQYGTDGQTSKPELSRSIRRSQITDDTFTQLEDKYSFIIAPYFDNRSAPSVRVIIIVHHEKVKELYCLFFCQTDNVIPVRGQLNLHSDRFGFPYVTADLLCSEPQDCYPQYVSLHTSPEPNLVQLPVFKIKNRSSEGTSVEFTVCISTMFGSYNNILQFIQSIEMYKMLGAQRVVIYKNSCSQLMEQVLRYYISEGTVEIVPWPIHLYLNVSHYWHHSMDAKDIGYYGQTAALNDCIYRNMYRSKYVLLNDPDEVILPLKDADWKSLMQRLQEKNPSAGAFQFDNYVFRNNVFAPSVPFNFSSWDSLPGVNMFLHIHKEPIQKGSFNNRKMVVDPRKVIQTSVHSVLKINGESVEVPNGDAITFHCRRPEWKDLPEKSLVQDTVLWRYNTTLIANVNKVLQKSNILKANTKV
uniref:Glycosyltransferase family 92 protein n=1 Tax=Salvator merianae TaxID=96440 RepID=A0A8D0DK64_SALMN